ncbi:immunity 26/phosphotriesterase HocA family protein [Flavobacteriaceae bacterium 3-367]|uniref:immunity 26/phosphotriesterase HocA family protein n=1 Tax=Eudoraea algarum TaxID=3417568 RepID=UPI00327F0EF9
MSFELNNEHREYLGLPIIPEHWERVDLKGDSYRPKSVLYYDGNVIKRHIQSTETSYIETQYNEETENRQLLLPKTNKGKPKKLSPSTLESRTPIGVYFKYTNNGIYIGNHTTQRDYYSTYFEAIKFKSIAELPKWLEKYISETSKEDLEEIEDFASRKRERVKLKEGDYFVFKVDRRNYGFGRLVCDLRKLRKDPGFKLQKNYGIMNLMTQPLVIKVYHLIQGTREVDLDYLKRLDWIPSQYIMDNALFYGDFEIIGNQPLEDWEFDFPISYSKSNRYDDPYTVYLQYGMIYKETSIKKFNKHLNANNSNKDTKPWQRVKHSNIHRMEGISGSLNFDKSVLESCIAEHSNQPYWDSKYFDRDTDLRNPKNGNVKKEIFEFFKLDSEKNYYYNYISMANNKKSSFLKPKSFIKKLFQ